MVVAPKNRGVSLTVPIVTPLDRLPMRWRPAVPLTDDELFEFCGLNRDLRIERTREGELVIMPPAGSETGHRNFNLNGLFAAWVIRDGTGVGFDSSTGFILPNGAERSPDSAWIRKPRWEALKPEQRRKFAPICPDFVIELTSPSDLLRDVKAKMDEYIENGARLGWLLDAEARRVYVYRPGRPVECLENPETVSGDPELPGFVLELSKVWD